MASILTIAGVIFIGVGILGGEITGQFGFSRKLSGWERTLAGSVGIFFLIIAYRLDSRQTPLPSDATRAITLMPITTDIVSSSEPQIHAQATHTIGIPSTIPAETQTSPVIPISTISSSPTSEPPMNLVPVQAAEENGIQVSINTAGLYKVTYVNDAYSPWPNDQSDGYQGWTTIVRIYINRSVEWGKTEYGLIGPINQDDYLSPGGYYLDKNQAMRTSTGDSRTFRLNAGDYLVLVPLDEKGRYRDNQGKVDVGITYLGP